MTVDNCAARSNVTLDGITVKRSVCRDSKNERNGIGIGLRIETGIDE
jgi:hypothetical protein